METKPLTQILDPRITGLDTIDFIKSICAFFLMLSSYSALSESFLINVVLAHFAC